MWGAIDCIPALLECLPSREELLNYLDAFEKRVQICSFPHVPNEVTKTEVDRFLSDAKKNAEMHPDMLALLFAALALGSQHCVFDKSGGKWVEGAMEKESRNGDIYIAASMQSLRMASFMNRPTLLAIQTLIMMGPYLTNSGRFLDAWTLFGTTVRLAQSIGLHRHPKVLDPAPPLRESMLRRTLWWWMLHMDQQYSMTLGRPLGISGIGDCPPPDDLTTDPTILRFSECVNKFTLLARQILSSDRLNNAKIDEFTDQLRKLWDTVPETLQFEDAWLQKDREIPEWPIDVMAAVFYSKTHNYLILLNRQRIDHAAPTGNIVSPFSPKMTLYSSMSTGPDTPKSHHASTLLHRGRPLVLSSSLSLLSAFFFFYARAPAALICWTMGQQAFNSCMILLLDAMETGDMSRIEKVEKAYAVFVELERKGVHKLAALAVERISWGLTVLKKRMTAAQAQKTHSIALGKSQGGDGDVEMHGETNTIFTNDTIQEQDIQIDTVMGNTGMLLLEDPGLQCFVPESFEPLTWKMGENSLRRSSVPERRQQEQDPHQNQRQEQQKQGGREHEANQGVSMSISMSSVSSGQMTALSTKQGFRSGDGMTGDTRSPQGSAPGAYATFYTAPSHGSPDRLEPQQPQGLTSPMSPLSGAFPEVVQQDRQQLKHQPPRGGIEMHPQAAFALPLRPFSSPRQQLPSSSIAHQQALMQSQTSSPTPQSSANPSPMPTHLTSPLDSGLIASPASSMGEPTTQSSYYPQQMAQSVHPSWAARPAMMSSGSAPIFSDPQNYEYGTAFGSTTGPMDHSAQEWDDEEWEQYLGALPGSGWSDEEWEQYLGAILGSGWSE
jgi:hypothetical protein